MVYVLNIDGMPIMPTENHAKVRVLLKTGKAKVVKRTPFTIQLLYSVENGVQEVSLGVDAGSGHIGISATTDKKELFASDVQLRTDIVELLSARIELRKSRRNRKTRYRKCRFDNRIHAKKKGWLTPSIRQRIESHLTVIRKVYEILPITNLVIETASFDIQKIQNPAIIGAEYQQGEQLGFWNVREYVLFRDGHACQCCHGASKNKVLNVHHIESRKTGGNAPSNLVTLCETCHTGYHKGTVKLPKEIKPGMHFRDAAFMGIMRWALYNKLKELYPNVNNTYGYLTKNARIENNLPKEHYIDARCISGHPKAEPAAEVFYQRKVRCHNRQIHKCKILKGGNRKRNQADYIVKGFRLFDKVRFNGQECFIFGRRSSGSFDIRTLDGTKLSAGVSYKKLKLLEKRGNYLKERRTAFPPTVKTVGFHA